MEPDSPDTRQARPLTDPKDWNDWKWQMRNRLSSVEELQRWIRLTPAEVNGIKMANGRFPVAITPYWASLLDPLNPRCPLRMQVVPTACSRQPPLPLQPPSRPQVDASCGAQSSRGS